MASDEEKPCAVCALPPEILAGVDGRLRGDGRPAPMPVTGVCGWLSSLKIDGKRLSFNHVTVRLHHEQHVSMAPPMNVEAAHAMPREAGGIDTTPRDQAAEVLGVRVETPEVIKQAKANATFAKKGRPALAAAQKEVGEAASPSAYAERSHEAGRPLTGPEVAAQIRADEAGLDNIFEHAAHTLKGVLSMVNERVQRTRDAKDHKATGPIVSFSEASLIRGGMGGLAAIAKVRRDIKQGLPGASGSSKAAAAAGLKGILAAGRPPPLPGDTAVLIDGNGVPVEELLPVPGPVAAAPVGVDAAEELADGPEVAETPPASGTVPQPSVVLKVVEGGANPENAAQRAAVAAGVAVDLGAVSVTTQTKWSGVWSPPLKRTEGGGGKIVPG